MRQKLLEVAAGRPDLVVQNASITVAAYSPVKLEVLHAIQRSIFCLILRGDSYSSRREKTDAPTYIQCTAHKCVHTYTYTYITYDRNTDTHYTDTEKCSIVLIFIFSFCVFMNYIFLLFSVFTSFWL